MEWEPNRFKRRIFPGFKDARNRFEARTPAAYFLGRGDDNVVRRPHPHSFDNERMRDEFFLK